jgi:hypothetical protein
MYDAYKNGTPISEIVNKTGIKRKTWNKRFERLKKKNKLTTNNNNENNNYSELIITKKAEINGGDNSAIINDKDGDKMAENVSTTNTLDSKGASHDITQAKKDRADPLGLLFIVLLIIGLILLFKWIYGNYNNWKLIKNEEE